MTPMPRSVIVAFAPGKAMPWSVVQITSVLLGEARVASSASSTAPTPRSSERALAMNAAMSARVSTVSGRFAGGRT